MRRHRTTALTILCVLLTGLAATAVSAPARGAGRGAVPKLVFPLVAKTDLWDNYGDPRPNGRHQGIDMENPWHAPAVAVEDGRVEYAQSNLGGCMLYLYGRSGTMYLYIHLNNDLTAKNDNRGGCVRDVTFTIPDGAKVTAGQQVAWVGDSGDANGNPHLHFEVHPNGGTDVDPFKFLAAAGKPLFAARTGSIFSLALRGELVSGGAGTATLEVERVRQYPGGRWLDVVPCGRGHGSARHDDLPLAPNNDGSVARKLKTRAGRGVHGQGEHDARRDRRRPRRARARPRRPCALT